MKVFYLFPFLIFLLAINSCKPKEVKDPTEFEISNIPIQDSAKLMLVVTGDIDGLTDNELFVITSKDKVKKQSLNNTSGSDASEILRPDIIANATPEYMIVTFTRSSQGGAYEGYFIHKKTGKLISLGERTEIPEVRSFATTKNHILCQYDGQRYLYYTQSPMNTYHQLIKYDMQTLTKMNILKDSIAKVASFEVDKEGNIMADVDAKSGKRRFQVFNNNVTQEVPDFYPNQYFVGLSGSFYLKTSGSLKKCTYDATNKVFNFNKIVDLTTDKLNMNFYRDYLYKVIHQDKLIVLNDISLFELDNQAHNPKYISTIPLMKTIWVDHSKALGHLYVAGESASGQETIFNIDLSNYSYTTYPQAGKYSFYEIEAFEDGTIYATAKRKSDSKNVILKFAPDGTETVLYDQLGTKKGVWLEKVTEFVND